MPPFLRGWAKPSPFDIVPGDDEVRERHMYEEND